MDLKKQSTKINTLLKVMGILLIASIFIFNVPSTTAAKTEATTQEISNNNSNYAELKFVMVKDYATPKIAAFSKKAGAIKKEIEVAGKSIENSIAIMEEIDPTKPMVALTFDDGPYPIVSNKILDCLKKNNAHATFYVVGNRCQKYQNVIKRIAQEGSEIGNHTYEHKYLDKLTSAQIKFQIDETSKVIYDIAGVKNMTVRPTGGNVNKKVIENVNAPIILWSIDTEDWKTRNTKKTVDSVMSKVKDGDIILMHDLYNESADAAVILIPKLKKAGYQLVTVSELAKHRGEMENGKIYHSFRPNKN